MGPGNNRDKYASYANTNNQGIIFYDPKNMAEFIGVIVKTGLTYEVSHMTHGDKNDDEFWIITLTGGF